MDQFVDAMYPNGSDEPACESSAADWAYHIIAFPWKLICAFCPPTDYGGGWVCFFVSLLFIAGITVIIKDFAALFGCCMDVPDLITCITFVALGTSLPDTFASKSAAIQDEHADASIGNVTGSNSVNVFLGLGLPWTMGALYWGGRGEDSPYNSKWAARAIEMLGPKVGTQMIE